jgi:K+-sensing histidine kinase KdpD
MWFRRGDDTRLFPTGNWYRDPCYTGAALADAVAARLSAPAGSLPDEVAKSGRPQWLEGLKERTNWLSGPHDDELGVATALAVPVWSRTEVIGVAVFFTDDAVAPELHTLELVEQVVTQLGAAVRRFTADTDAADDRTSSSVVTESLGAVAHHVRTPLNGLIGNLELLCDGGLAADAKDLASRALQSAIDLHRQFERWLVDADTDTNTDTNVEADTNVDAR